MAEAFSTMFSSTMTSIVALAAAQATTLPAYVPPKEPGTCRRHHVRWTGGSRGWLGQVIGCGCGGSGGWVGEVIGCVCGGRLFLLSVLCAVPSLFTWASEISFENAMADSGIPEASPFAMIWMSGLTS